MATAQPRAPFRYSRFQFALLALILLGCLLRIANVLHYNPMDALYSDPGRHWYHAEHFPEDTPLGVIDPIGYQVWLAGVAKLTQGDPMLVAIYAGILSVITPWFWYRFAREAFASKTLAILCWALITWMPSWVGIYSYFMSETLLLPLFGLALWMTFRARRKKTVLAFALCVLTWILACLTRVIVLPAALICILALITESSDRLRRAAVAVAVTLVLCAIPAWRTHRILGVWTPFGYPVMNQIFWSTGVWEIKFDLQRRNPPLHFVYVWGAPTVDERPLAPLSDWKVSRRGSTEVFISLDAGARDWVYLFKRFSSSPQRGLELARDNIIVGLFGDSWPEIFFEERTWERWASYTRFLFAPLLLMIAVWSLVVWLRNRDIELLPMTTLFLWACFLLLPSAPMNGRFRKPLEGVTVICALWLLDESPRKRKEPARSRLQEVRTY